MKSSIKFISQNCEIVSYRKMPLISSLAYKPLQLEARQSADEKIIPVINPTGPALIYKFSILLNLLNTSQHFASQIEIGNNKVTRRVLLVSPSEYKLLTKLRKPRACKRSLRYVPCVVTCFCNKGHVLSVCHMFVTCLTEKYPIHEFF